jgi:hypothetical protein
MKLVALLIPSLLLTNISFAGSPDQDPVVRMLRDKFEKASLPTIQELQMEKTWVCKEYSAVTDEFDTPTATPLFRFGQFDGIITNQVPHIRLKEAAYVSEGLVGNFYDNNSVSMTFRISQEGDLIAEATTTKPGKRKLVSSIAHPLIGAAGYVICPLDRMSK